MRLIYPLALLSVTCTAKAEQPQKLEPIIISTPLHKKAAETMHPVNILTGTDLALKQGATIGETLKQELGIHSSSFGSSVGRPVIRGQLGTRVQVLQNGISSLDISDVSPDHANSTEGIFAQQIEVLRGPASLLYGSGAIGGVVNVIDNRIPMYVPETLKTTFSQGYNSVSNAWTSALKNEGGVDKFAWHLDGFFRENSAYQVPNNANKTGVVSNTDAQKWSATAGGSWNDDWGMLGLSINYLDNNYGVPPADPDELVRIAMQQIRYDVKAEIYEPFSWAETLKLRFSYNDYQHVELEDAITVGTQFDNQGIEARAELVHKKLAFIDHGALGFQMQHKDFEATGEEAFIPPSILQNYSFFAVEDIHVGAVTYEAGLRVEYQHIAAVNHTDKEHTPVNFSLSALWSATDNIQLSLAFTHAQRAPNVQELFANGVHFATQSYELGNEDLALEASYNLEMSFITEWQGLSTELNVFHNWSNNYIIQQATGNYFNLDTEQINASCDGSCLPVYQVDQQNARFYGFEAQVAFPLWHADSYSFDGRLFADYVRGELNSGGNVPFMPPLRYGFQIDATAYSDFSAGLKLTRAAKQTHTANNETDTAGYVLLDVNMAYNWQISQTTDALFFVKGNNLLNQTVRNSTSFLKAVAPEPGIGAEIGVKINF